MKIDKKRMKVFKKSIKDISDTVIQIGAIGQHADSDLSNSDLLIIHEFGATIKKTGVKIPARHPIRTGILSNISVIRKNIQGLITLRLVMMEELGELGKKVLRLEKQEF